MQWDRGNLHWIRQCLSELPIFTSTLYFLALQPGCCSSKQDHTWREGIFGCGPVFYSKRTNRNFQAPIQRKMVQPAQTLSYWPPPFISPSGNIISNIQLEISVRIGEGYDQVHDRLAWYNRLHLRSLFLLYSLRWLNIYKWLRKWVCSILSHELVRIRWWTFIRWFQTRWSLLSPHMIYTKRLDMFSVSTEVLQIVL